MPLEPLFTPYRSEVESSFARARAGAGPTVSDVAIVLAEEPRRNGSNRAEVLAIGEHGPVHITWNAIASIWALSQGAARLSRRIFDARRRSATALRIADDPELARGLHSLVLANRLRFMHPLLQHANANDWPEWAPPIDPDAKVQTDTWAGNRYFGAALEWIFRHELAHLTLGHNRVEVTSDQNSRELESEADLEATEWVRGNLVPDANRARGAVPSIEETTLEGRAICVGIVLLWVAFMEAGRHGTSTSHPAVADRIFSCFDTLGLREDSGAKEITADLIKLWIDPEKDWSVSQVSDESLSDALLALQRHLANPPDRAPTIGT